MNLKYRKIIAKTGPLYRIIRFAMYNSGYFFYKKKSYEKNYKQVFTTLKNSHFGEKCFIIGNGPSLAVDDLERINHFDCFGTNDIYHIFPKTNWRPRYYLITDRYSKASPEIIKDMEVETVFLGDYYWRFNQVYRQDAICLHQHEDVRKSEYRFSEDISKCIYNSPTVSYGAMQIAAYLGYKEIYLLGFDHDYTYEFDRKGKVFEKDNVKSHFFEDDFPEEIIANTLEMTEAYKTCLEYCNKHGIVIKNATRGGLLKVFERVDFDELLR